MCGVGRFMKLNNMAQGVGRVGIGVRHGFKHAWDLLVKYFKGL